MNDDALSFLGDESPTETSNGKYTVSFSAFFRDTPEAVNNVKQRFTELQNILGCNKTRAITRIFEAGMAALEEQHKTELDPLRLAFARKRQELDKQKHIVDQLTAFYAQMPLEEFLAFCTEAGVPDDLVDSFLAGYTWHNTDQRWATRAHDFLRELLAAGEAVDTKTIRESAVAAAIIADTPEEWARLRVLASRSGLTNCPQHGHWQSKPTL